MSINKQVLGAGSLLPWSSGGRQVLRFDRGYIQIHHLSALGYILGIKDFERSPCHPKSNFLNLVTEMSEDSSLHTCSTYGHYIR